ncbi:di- and tricarboxylate transporter [Iodidimonas gelatinilytica]|uniref:Di-and tricarboxylate transporter n=1 Tax=Iodidimonas gelatinilytica TaxID=1236966 RepID=A0A5A7MSQ9_9PROT|nr:di- and tricarboxylate transporter [Iodidimonas gelatinilytica]
MKPERGKVHVSLFALLRRHHVLSSLPLKGQAHKRAIIRNGEKVSENQIASVLQPQKRALYQNIGLVLGPVLAVLVFVLPPPAGLSDDAWIVVALAVWMASWWAVEAIPVPATSLLPLIVLPLAGVTSAADASRPFAEPVIFLLLGGFVMAMAMQRWGLHKRIALHIVARSGDRPGALILGFMVATALLSMWVSNTATCLMMLPIALMVTKTVLGDKADRHPFGLALVLGIAWSASIGGLGTIIGTPPNAFVVGFVRETQGVEIAFIQWMAFGVPVVAVMIPTAWFVLTRLSFRFAADDVHGGHAVVTGALVDMGRMSTAEKRVALVFAMAGGAWALRLLLNDLPGLAYLSDMNIAIAGALAMFLVPAGKGQKDGAHPQAALLDWDQAARLPWGVLLLFGGGLSLAAAIRTTGLAQWMGNGLAPLTDFPLIFLIGAIVLLIIFLTELTSNTATVAALVPILGSIADVSGFAPILLAAPAAMAGSSAFMLPVATAPNAIVYASGQIRIPDMVKAGFRLNLLGTLVITVLCWWIVPVLFG